MLRLVDCSMLSPPRPGPDERARYAMLERLRAFGAERRPEAGEGGATARGAGRVRAGMAEAAAAGLESQYA